MPVDPKISAESLSLLACPETRAALEAKPESGLTTTDGRHTYAVRHGVANFLSRQTWDSPHPAHLRRLIEVARADGYQQAIETVLDDPTYVTNTSRMLYLDLLDLRSDSRVLEIGASLGQHTRAIAKRCGHLEALEVIPEQAIFARLCCAQDGLTNVNVSLGGDQCRLPYRDDSFDFLIMNYVLEWSAGRSGLHPEKAHALLLSECQRVLRPGGVLFLSTKNRFALRLLKGGIDEHVEFRYGNALPRWLMRVRMNRRPTSKSPGYLHSYRGLRNLLKRSGFASMTPLLALPDGRYPQVYAKFEKQELARLREDRELLSSGRATRVLVTKIPFRAKKWFAPSLVFLAGKADRT